ncbi:MAG: hypothetical protein Q4A76_06355, partial [Porphyromonadaceae bacterium]|nr:hypothetical protein [Porphyromonadaceae bacterium]
MVLVPFTAQMTAAAGKCFMNIELLEGEKAKNSQPIPLSIEKNAVSNSDIISDDEMLNIHELLEKYQLWIENLP